MYFGSVKFFKNMLLLVVILAIGISAAFAFYYHHQWVQLQSSVDAGMPVGGHGSYSPVEADGIDYQSLYPDFYAPQTYHATDRQSGKIYLTFDGAISSSTADLLTLLSQRGIKATFFVSGSTDTEDVGTLKSIVAAGHTIGMSSWSSDYQTLYNSVESYLADAYQLFSFIQQTTGVTPTVFRFPGGSINSYNAGFYRELIAEMIRRGFVPYDWNINFADQSSDSNPETLLDGTMDRLNSMDRAVFLLQPNSFAVDILPLLIDRLQENNFSCDALHETTKPVLFAYPE